MHGIVFVYTILTKTGICIFKNSKKKLNSFFKKVIISLAFIEEIAFKHLNVFQVSLRLLNRFRMSHTLNLKSSYLRYFKEKNQLKYGFSIALF